MLLFIGVHKAVPADQFGVEKLPAMLRARQEWCDWLVQSRRLPRQRGWGHNVTGCEPLQSILSWSLVSLAACGWMLTIRSVTQRYAHRSQTELRCLRSIISFGLFPIEAPSSLRLRIAPRKMACDGRFFHHRRSHRSRQSDGSSKRPKYIRVIPPAETPHAAATTKATHVTGDLAF